MPGLGLVLRNSVENLVPTRVPIQSLRASGGMQDFMAIVPKNMADTTPAGHTNILTDDGVKFYYSDPIPMPESMDIDPGIHARCLGVMNKFAAWRLTKYTQVALVDTDMVFSFDSQNPGRMF